MEMAIAGFPVPVGVPTTVLQGELIRSAVNPIRMIHCSFKPKAACTGIFHCPSVLIVRAATRSPIWLGGIQGDCSGTQKEFTADLPEVDFKPGSEGRNKGKGSICLYDL
jgi:hypothetical protein